MAKLAFWRTIADAYLFIFGHPLRFLRLAWFWLTLLVLFRIWSDLPWQPGPNLTAQAFWTKAGLGFGGLIVIGLGLLSFAVALHRAVIFGEVRPSWAVLRLRGREWLFLGYGLAIGLLLFVAVMIFLFLAQDLIKAFATAVRDRTTILLVLRWWSVASLAYLLLLWIPGSRLMLIFPAVAADEPSALDRAWVRGRGNWLRLYAGSIACYLPFVALEQLIPVLLGPKTTVTTKVVLQSGAYVSLTHGGGLHDAISSVVDFLELAVMIAYYSIAHRQLTGTAAIPGDAAPQPLPAG